MDDLARPLLNGASDYRNEVWNQIERHTEVADGQGEKQLCGKRGPFVSQNALIYDQFTFERASNLFHGRFLRSEDFLLQNSAILRNAARMRNSRNTQRQHHCAMQ